MLLCLLDLLEDRFILLPKKLAESCNLCRARFLDGGGGPPGGCEPSGCGLPGGGGLPDGGGLPGGPCCCQPGSATAPLWGLELRGVELARAATKS